MNVYKHSPYLSLILIVLSSDPEAISPVFNSIIDITPKLCPLNVYKHSPYLFHIFIVSSNDPEAISPVCNSIIE